MKRRHGCSKLLYFLIFAAAITIGFGKPVAVEASVTSIKITSTDIANNGGDAYDVIQEALNEARDNATSSNTYTITVEKGDYDLTQCLHIYSNTYLDVSNVTFTQQNSETNMIMVGISTDTQSGYCYKNITIKGGTWDENGYEHPIFKAAHASNVTLANCTFMNIKDNHLMEVAGISGLTITGCTFEDQVLSTSADTKAYEAIQLDILEENHFQSYTYEDLATKNVVIDSCEFYNVPRGIGSHTTIFNNPLDGITITNCIFDDCGSCAIQGMNWINCTITGNEISGCPRGIAIYSVRDSGTFLSSTIAKESGLAAVSSVKYTTPFSNQNIVISNNTINCSGTDSSYESVGIFVSGYLTSDSSENATNDEDSIGDTVPSGDYYISGVTISNNEVSIAGHGIRLYDTKNTTISDNTITGKTTSGSTAYYGIQIRMGSTSVSIKDNTINKAPNNGIYVSDNSSATVISGNTIASPKKYGIDIEASTATTIDSNTISSASDNGIFIYGSSTATTISNNTISSAGSYGIAVNGSTAENIKSNTIISSTSNGIYISNSAKVTGSISSNTVTSAGNYGIDVESATVKTISGNKISKAKSNGIFACISATVTTISSNTISSAGAYGIAVNKSTVTNIKSNKITSAKTNGIYISNSGNVTGSISSNTISSAGKYGIDVEKATVKTISSNTISKAKSNGIFIYNSAKATTISKNTISSAGAYGIAVNKSTVSTISSNKITSAKTNGIYISNSAKVSSKISSNTISSAGKYGIDVEKSTVKTISSNTISKAKSNAIFVYNSGKVTTISSNKITSPGKYGIAVDKGTATTIKSNTISSPTSHGIFVQNSGKVKTIKSNTIKSGKARGISINSLQCDLTISSNTISKCAKDAEIYLAPNTTAYTITVKSNKITGKSSVDGIYAGTNCKVSIKGNTIKSANRAIYLTTKVKGSIYKNTYSSNKNNKVTYGSKTYSNLSKPSSVKASKASSTSIKLSWKKVSNASGYYIYRSTSKDGTYTKVATVKSGSTVSYTNKSLKSGKTYYYKVVAYRKTSDGNITIISEDSSIVSKKL